MTNYKQLKIDQKKFKYKCNDGLFIKLKNNSNQSYGIIFVHSWNKKSKLKDFIKDFYKVKNTCNQYIMETINILENFSLHTKIKSLISNQNKLKEKLFSDEVNLKKRIKELSTVYEFSNEINNSLNYEEVTKKVLLSLNKVLEINISSIYIKMFNQSQLYILKPQNLSKTHSDIIMNHALESMESFTYSKINKKELNVNYVLTPIITIENHEEYIRNSSTIPLIFQNEIFGIITIHSKKHVPI